MDSINSLADFGRQVRFLRKARNMSQWTLADMTGIERSHVSNLETGKREPRLNTVIRICKALEIRLLFVIDDKTVKEKEHIKKGYNEREIFRDPATGDQF